MKDREIGGYGKENGMDTREGKDGIVDNAVVRVVLLAPC
jgi:hypothetical protein